MGRFKAVKLALLASALLSTGGSAVAQKQNTATQKVKAPEKLKGFFVYYQSYDRTMGCVIKRYNVIVPLKVEKKASAIDTFNSILARNIKLLNFLNQDPKIYLDIDDPEMNYFIKAYRPDSLNQEIFNKLLTGFWRNKGHYGIVEHSTNYGNFTSTLILFEAELTVVAREKEFPGNVCCWFQIGQNYVYPTNFNGQCHGYVPIHLELIH